LTYWIGEYPITFRKHRRHSLSQIWAVSAIFKREISSLYPFEKIKPILTEILEIVIADGKGIELNTSGYRDGLRDSSPSVDILKLYHQLGGSIITIGSDSHKKEHLGMYIREAKKALKNLGYQEFCTFYQMQPVFYLL